MIKKITIISIICLFNGMIHAQNSRSAKPAIRQLANYQNIRDFSLSSDGSEAYVTVQSPLVELSVLLQLRKVNEEWLAPAVLHFSGKYQDLEPFLSPDNLRLYFASNRPINKAETEAKDFDIWYVTRENIQADWGQPVNMGPPINTAQNEFYPSLSKNNNLYFTSDGPAAKGKDDIFFSEWTGTDYTAPISMSESINTEGYEFNAYVAPDETYLIFSGYNRDDGLGSGDLYISYQDKNKKWSKALNLGPEINSKQMDYCPFVDAVSMSLYFTSKRSVFDEIQNIQSIEELDEALNKAENGLSKIYKVAFSAKE